MEYKDIRYLASVIKEFLNKVPENYLFTSATLVMFRDNPELAIKILLFLNNNIKDKVELLDLGCGYGYLTILFKNILGFENAYGVDIDNERLKIAEKLGVKTFYLDLEKDPLPFPDNYFNLVIAAGIFNHLKFWDNTLREANRVLEPNGLLFISNPNMGWWVERISLLLGYQPPGVEVSEVYTVNLPPFYPREKPIGYIHSLTLKGFIQLLSLYNFECLKIFPTKIPKIDLDLKKPPIPSIIKYIVKTVDYIFCIFPNLSIRPLIICKKAHSIQV